MPLTRYERDLLDEGVSHIVRALSIVKKVSGLQVVHSELVDALAYLYELQAKMEAQGTRRKRNPPLILLSNPPMRYKGSQSGHGSLKFLDLISDECHAILYRHAEDGKPYRHDFERPTQLVAVERNGKKDVLITSEDGAPIWQDF